MTERLHMGSRGGGKSRGCRCGTALMARVMPTLEAADQVACEFVRDQRIQFLAQAITREHEGIAEADAKGLAELFVVVSE